MTTYGYYPGCALHSSSREYDLSVRAISQALGVELREIDDWNCCGASPAHWSREELSLALCQRNINLARGEGLEVVVAPCAACYNRFRVALSTLRQDEEKRRQVEEALGQEAALEVRVIHLLELLHERIVKDEFVPERPLGGLKVACYYGCLLLRPPKAVAEDDPENPTKMEEVIRALGAEAIEWPQKTCCCGASAGVTEVSRAERLSGGIVSAAKRKGADLIVAACPLCQVNLEVRQGGLGMPVVYISQLVGLALGKGPKEVGLDLLLIDPMPTLRKRGVV